jgi:hypothetical protein
MYFEVGKLDLAELQELLVAYDQYIQEANEEEKYSTGFKPVCIAEFYDNEFQEGGE